MRYFDHSNYFQCVMITYLGLLMVATVLELIIETIRFYVVL